MFLQILSPTSARQKGFAPIRHQLTLTLNPLSISCPDTNASVRSGAARGAALYDVTGRTCQLFPVRAGSL